MRSSGPSRPRMMAAFCSLRKSAPTNPLASCSPRWIYALKEVQEKKLTQRIAIMVQRLKFYIDGAWQDSGSKKTLPVVNPATEEALYEVAFGSAADVDKAVAAARRAFETFSLTTREQRVELLSKVIDVYKRRLKDIGAAISDEMGAPLGFAERFQAGAGLGHLMTTLEVLKTYPFEERLGSAMIVREPVGVVGMITPWNWPLNQIACKVAPALAAGCTMILKPSENTPSSALIFAEILDEAGVPKGVFNLVNGLGGEVGAAMSAHPGIDMMSFTGSTRAGIDVAQRAAPTVKRVTQELGGKSPNIILEDAELSKSIAGGTAHCFNNSGQSCNAPTRMLVPLAKMKEAAAIAKGVADKAKVGDPRGSDTTMGPVVNRVQWEKIQGLIKKGIDEGATLVTGGLGRPDGLNKGYYVRPTVFADVSNDMTIAREEIFGPVLSIIGYQSEDDAVRMANDTPYGLAGYVSSGDVERARRVARRMRAGNVNVNGAANERAAPFGGYKQSGNGREWGRFGFEEFMEVKAVAGWGA
jgi:aldehyde dehydrogenase (NAD+)